MSLTVSHFSLHSGRQARATLTKEVYCAKTNYSTVYDSHTRHWCPPPHAAAPHSAQIPTPRVAVSVS